VATVLIGAWTKEIDKARVEEVLSGRLPFDEKTLLDEAHGAPAAAELPEQREDGEKELASA
jgi:aerobic C4-dicarboxylate transport protein